MVLARGRPLPTQLNSKTGSGEGKIYQIKCWQSQAQINARKTKTGKENTSGPCKNESKLFGELAEQRQANDQKGLEQENFSEKFLIEETEQTQTKAKADACIVQLYVVARLLLEGT